MAANLATARFFGIFEAKLSRTKTKFQPFKSVTKTHGCNNLRPSKFRRENVFSSFSRKQNLAKKSLNGFPDDFESAIVNFFSVVFEGWRKIVLGSPTQARENIFLPVLACLRSHRNSAVPLSRTAKATDGEINGNGSELEFNVAIVA